MKKFINIFLSLPVILLLTGCYATSNLQPTEQLYTGMKKIDWKDYQKSASNMDETKAEVEAAISIAPNGALFGSPYYRTPFPYGLWIWNTCHDSKNAVGKWFNKSFGKQPVLMQNVNVPLRTSVAKSVLANHGYFHGDVTYDIIEGKLKKFRKDSIPRAHTAMVLYHVKFGDIYTLDTISYSGFPDEAMKYIKKSETLLHTGDPFSIATLDNERTRIFELFRNKGFYYYQKGLISYFADTLNVPHKVQVQMHLADSLDSDIMRRWVIGSTTLNLRRTMFEHLTDSLQRKFLFINFGGKKPPVRARVLLQQLKLRPGSIFSQQAYQESLNNLSVQGIYSSIDIEFAKRLNADGTTKLVPDSIKSLGEETRAGAGVLDMTVNAVLDKPYFVTFGAKLTGKTNDRLGPGLELTLTKRNAFRGGEMFSITGGANYEFQLANGTAGNSYDFSLSTSLTFPRLLVPNWKKRRKRWYTTPSTTITLSAETQRRAGFFTRNVFSGDISYLWQPNQVSVHKLTPFSLTYGRTTNTTEAFEKKMEESTYTSVANQPEFTPRIRYTYTYSSPSKARHPFYMQASVQEAGNLTALGFMIAGRSWNEEDKKILGTPFSQFFKFEADFRKTWQITDNSTLVLHFYGGYIRPLGNDDSGPFSEQMYVGGANDLRGFAMRTVGPGSVHFSDKQLQYAFHNGDLKLVFNAEWRPKIFGSLYGALFLDAGNVWYINHNSRSVYKVFGIDSAAKDVAIDVGLGLRYDLDYFVLRLDWGFAIHRPYYDNITIKDNVAFIEHISSGFFNVSKFSEMQCINIAIGYPF